MVYNFADYQLLKKEVIEVLQQTCDFLRRLDGDLNGAPQRYAVLLESIQRLRQDDFNLVVAGEFSSGKSSLINVLIGAYRVDTEKGKVRGLLPDRISPTTSAITVIRYGQDPKAKVLFANGEQQEVDLEHLAEFVADPSFKEKYLSLQNEDESNLLSRSIQAAARGVSYLAGRIGWKHEERKVRRVEIDYDSPLLAQGVCIVDTPGTGSVVREHAEVTQEFIPKADAVIFLFPAQPPINKPTQLFLSQCAFHVGKMFFVQTMKDREYERSRDGEWKPRMERDVPVVEVALQENLKIIREVVPDVTRVYVVSAKWYALASSGLDAPKLEESGVPQLLQDLENFLVRERGYATLQTHLHRARTYLQESQELLETLIEAKQSSLRDLQAHQEKLQQVIERVKGWIDEVGGEIRRSFLRVCQQVEDDYSSAVQKLTERLHSKIEACHNISDLAALETVLPLAASSFINARLSRWIYEYLHPAVDRLYEDLRSGSLAQVDIPESSLTELPRRTRVAISHLLAKVTRPMEASGFDAIGQRVRSTLETGVERWLRWVSKIPFIGEWLAAGRVEQVKQHLLHDAYDLSAELMRETKERFADALKQRADEMVAGMKEQMQSFLSAHLTPIENELSKGEDERREELQKIENYRVAKQRCLQIINTIDMLQEQLSHGNAQGAHAPSTADVPNHRARMQ